MKRSLRYLLGVSPLLVSSLVAAKDKPSFNAFDVASATRATPVSVTAPAAVVASRDTQREIPTFLRADPARSPAVQSLTPVDAAREHLTAHAARYGLTPSAVQSASVQAVHDIGRGGILVTLRQSIDGVELFHRDVKVLLSRDLRLVAIGGNLHASAVPSRKHGTFTVQEDAAITAALSDLYEVAVAVSDLEQGAEMPGGYRAYRLASTPIAHSLGFAFRKPARIKRVYYALPDRVVPAYYLEISAREVGASEKDLYGYVIAADDGRVLYRANLTHNAGLTFRTWADEGGDHRPKDGPIADYSPYPAAMPNGSFPGFVPPSLITIEPFNKTKDPWLADGATMSSGNNVDAYTDDDNPDGFSANDIRATVTSPGTFDRVYDTSIGPQVNDEQRQASVASLFYLTNWLHDWWYDSGFDEKAGNAQKSNLGRGGIEGDALQAQAQNGAPTARDNSDMQVAEDGASPEMEMFVWTGKGGDATVTLAPSNQKLVAGTAAFGPPAFNVTGPVTLVDDGTAPTTNACEPIMGSLTGQIALIDRGTCTFEQKTLAAQKAGAIGVILADNVGGEPPPPMGGNGQGGGEKIGILSISLADGDALKAALKGGTVTATLSKVAVPDLDGTIDNTVAAHEWGHYLHLRQVSCNNGQCGAQSEGWGDFNALLMVLRDGDPLDGAYALAQYATTAFPDDPAYFGIRRYPYSTDLTKNPLTFKHIADGTPLPTTAPVASGAAQSPNSEVHAAGELWATMMFESLAALVVRSQGAMPAYSFTEARRRISDYVVMGMKLAPSDPTYTEQRDAILAAAAAADPADMLAIAKAFAKRGAGTCAVSPPRDSMTFAGVVESFSLEGNAKIDTLTVDDSVTSCDKDGHLDAGEQGKITVTVKNEGTMPVMGLTGVVSTTTAGAVIANSGKVTFPDIAPYGTQTATVNVSLDASVQGIQTLALVAQLAGGASCGGTDDKLSTSTAINYDEVANSSATDDVEAISTAWTLSGDLSAQIWMRQAVAGNHVWAGTDYGSPSDTSLVSPPLMVSATDKFVLTFKESHKFEMSMGQNFDGAVIEVSVDAGKTWDDISKYGNPGYQGKIGDSMGMSANVLDGRQGYVNTNKGYPAADTVTVDMGTSLASKTVQVRFRIGSDDAQGDIGWQLDDIAFTGIDNKPFPTDVANPKACMMGTGGAGGSGGSGGVGGSAGGNPTAGAGGAGAAGHPAGGGAAGHAGTPSAGAGGTPSGGHPGVGSTGGQGAAGTASGPAISPANDVSGSGCGCETTPVGNAGGVGAALLAAAIVAARRKRKPELQNRGRRAGSRPARRRRLC